VLKYMKYKVDDPWANRIMTRHVATETPSTTTDNKQHLIQALFTTYYAICDYILNSCNRRFQKRNNTADGDSSRRRCPRRRTNRHLGWILIIKSCINAIFPTYKRKLLRKRDGEVKRRKRQGLILYYLAESSKWMHSVLCKTRSKIGGSNP
jgi:hypothetical protein